MRLSSYTGDYVNRSSITDTRVVTALAGATEFQLKSLPGVEEVYLDGLRKSSPLDYVYNGESVIFAAPLVGGEHVHLIGRSNQQDFKGFNSASETITLGNGQLTVSLASLTTEGIELYVSNVNDSRKLISGTDYTIADPTTITLASSFAAGTVLEVYQGVRPAWPNPNDFIVYDGKTNMRLSDRLAATMIDSDYETAQNRYYSTATIGTYLQRYTDKIPDDNGVFTTVLYDGVFYDPQDNYSIYGDIETITPGEPLELGIRGTDNVLRTYVFHRRVAPVRASYTTDCEIRDGITEIVIAAATTVNITMSAKDSFTLIVDDQGGTLNVPASWSITFTPGPLSVYRGVRYGSDWLVEGSTF
jgi:hypothetical protein